MTSPTVPSLSPDAAPDRGVAHAAARPVPGGPGRGVDARPDDARARVERWIAARGIWLVLVAAACLNLWGIRWGTRNAWHGDELSRQVETLVREGRVNPHYFMYGGIAFYRTALGVGPALAYSRVVDRPPPVTALAERNAWQDRHDLRITTWPRLVSALEGVAVVFVAYLVGVSLFDRRVGLLGAALVALSPIVVYIAHVATADGVANLAYWLACLAALRSWRGESNRWLAAALCLAGVAMGAKTDRMLVVLPVAVAYAWRANRRWRDLWLLAALPVGYAAANPTLLLAPFEFLDGVSRDMFFGVVQDEGTERPYRMLLEYTRLGAGPQSFWLAAAGVGYALWRIARGRDRRPLVWLLATCLPYFALFGTRTVFPWYVAQFLPGLLLVGAYAAVRLADAVARRSPPLAWAGVAALLLLAALGPLSLGLQFTHDPRDAAGRWLRDTVPPDATVLVSQRGPWIPRGGPRVEVLLPDRARWTVNMATPRERLDAHPAYRRIRAAILASERWAGRTLGTPVRAVPYQGWYDVVQSELDTRPAAVDRVRAVQPDYVVIVEGMSPTLLDSIRAPGSAYEPVAEFRRYVPPVRAGLWMPMLNKEAFVFRRRDLAVAGRP